MKNAKGSTHHYPTPGGGEFIQNNEQKDGGNVISMTMNVNDGRLKEMEMRLETLSEKIMSLMGKIEELTERNQHLEMSKMELIANFSNEMNEYRQTVRTLSQQNNMLLAKIRNK